MLLKPTLYSNNIGYKITSDKQIRFFKDFGVSNFFFNLAKLKI